MARFFEYERVTLPDLPFRVLNQAHFRPQAAKMRDKDRPRQQQAAMSAGRNLAHQRMAEWHLEETWIDHSLHAFIAGIPNRVMSASIRSLCDGFAIAAPSLHRLRTRGLNHLVGDPDFVLIGGDAIVLGEIKVDTRKTSHRYSLQQHRKFVTQGALCSCRENQPNRVCHLLIVPDADPREFCSDFSRWQPRLRGNRLVFDDDGKLRAHVADVARSELAKGTLALSRRRVEESEQLDVAEIVPTFVCTWKDFSDVSRRELRSLGFDEYVASVDRLESLACGRGNGSNTSADRRR